MRDRLVKFNAFGEDGVAYAEALKDLASWLNSADRGKDLEAPLQRLNVSNLDVLSTIFQAIKYTQAGDADLPAPDKGTKFLSACFDAIDTAIGLGKASGISEQYEGSLERFSAYKAKKIQELKDLAEDTEHLRVVDTSIGVRLAFFDTRPVGVDFGGVGVAASAANSPDFVVVINNETNEEGDVLGTKVFIQRTSAEHSIFGSVDMRDLMEGRLNWMETVFGKGVVSFQRGYGGHANNIASAQFLGSNQAPEALNYALEDFFNSERYTEADFGLRAAELAHLVESDQVYHLAWESPDNRWSLPQRAVQVRVPCENGEGCVITITEADLRLYLEELSSIPGDNINARRSLLLQKTELTEPLIVARRRNEAANAELLRLLEDDADALRALVLVNKMNPSAVEAMDVFTQLELLKLISSSQDAVRKVWDISDTQYRISSSYLPEWLLDPTNLVEYQGSRYRYTSLPRRIDANLVASAGEKILDSADLVQQAEYAGAILNILSSQAYKNGHSKFYFDSLLKNTLAFASDSRTDPEIVKDVVTALREGYGSDMKGHWEEISLHSPEVFNALAQRSVGFRRFVEELGVNFKSGAEVIPGVPNSSVDLLALPEIGRQLEMQLEKGKTPTINLVLEVGRQIRQKAESFEVREFPGNGDNGKEAIGTVHGGVSVKGALDLSLSDNENDASQRVVESTIGLLDNVLDIAKESKARIRIISGGLPSQVVSDLSFELGLRYGQAAADAKEVFRRLVICRYNANSDLYEDVPLIRGREAA